VFQPELRVSETSGAAAIALPGDGGGAFAFPAFGKRGVQPAGGFDLVVDLGRNIGSGEWWRGLITVTLLCGSAMYISTRVPAITEPVAPVYGAAEIEEVQAVAIQPLAARSATGQRIAPNAMVRPLAETPERPRIEVAATLRSGNGLAETLKRSGVSADEAKTAATLIAGALPLDRLKSGTSLALVLGRRESKSVPRPLESLAFRAAFDLKLAVERSASGLTLVRTPIAVDDTPLRVTGTVGSSLYKSARAAGVPASLVADVIKALSYGLDFQRDVRGSDRFDIIVEHRRAETGETETGKLLFAGLDQGRKKVQMLRWTLGGREQFFDASGEATKKGLMRTPVDGARMSSGFGLRRHPILGYSRMHKGVDFAAGYGTPILAAAAGKVDYAGWHGGHGNYVKISHGSGMGSGYAHMSRFAVRSGQHVQQGQVIGYVGSTGLSTGPHLHYEFYRGGQAVDPRSVKFTSRSQLAGEELRRFKSKLNTLLAVAPGAKQAKVQTAKADPSKPKKANPA